MRRHPMPLAACKARLKRHKLELFDLGLDFDFQQHLYFILSIETGLPFMDELFFLGDVEKVVAILDAAEEVGDGQAEPLS
jgi:hypothetical protein